MTRPVGTVPGASTARPGPADSSWAAPGAFGVARGVYRIPLPLPSNALRAVNVYAIEDGDTLVLIDSGWALDVARTQLERALAGLGRTVAQISRFLMTHVHGDHYTQAILLRREFGSRLSLGIGERPSIELWASGRELRLAPQLRRLHACGAAPLADRVQAAQAARDAPRTEWELPDEWLAPGDIALTSRSLEAIPTPGHTRGHLCYRDEANGLLFAGDHVLPHITPSIGFETAAPHLPLASYLQSLRRVRDRPDARLLPAHGPVTPSVHARVDELLAHHDARLRCCGEAVAVGARTAYQVAQHLRWTRHQRPLGELAPFDQVMAVAETVAHLEVLCLQNRLTRRAHDDVDDFIS